MEKRNRITNGILTFIFAILSLVWIYPVVMVVLNSFKVERAISTNTAFKLPTADTFAGFANFADALSSKGFLSAFWYSLVITVTSVVLILVCCSMCAWFITRVNTWVSKLCYFLFVFSMVVPFQMLMFTHGRVPGRLSGCPGGAAGAGGGTAPVAVGAASPPWRRQRAMAWRCGMATGTWTACPGISPALP